MGATSFAVEDFGGDGGYFLLGGVRLSDNLRYTLSAARHLLPAYPPPHYEQLLNHLQVMGELQNSAVIINALEKFYVQGVPLDIQYLFQQQQVELLDAFTNLEPLTLTLPTTQA